MTMKLDEDAVCTASLEEEPGAGDWFMMRERCQMHYRCRLALAPDSGPAAESAE